MSAISKRVGLLGILPALALACSSAEPEGGLAGPITPASGLESPTSTSGVPGQPVDSVGQPPVGPGPVDSVGQPVDSAGQPIASGTVDPVTGGTAGPVVGAPTTTSGPTPTVPSSEVAPTEEMCAGSVLPGRAPLRRLTETEYRNTVSVLLGDVSTVELSFPPPEEAKGFLNNADQYTTTDLHVEAYQTAAEALAANYRAAGNLALSCAADAENCARTFITDFGQRVFRRPLTDAEVTSYYGTFQEGMAGGGFEDGLEWVVGLMLQSVNFLYRIELDGEGAADGEVVLLSGHSLATRLAYFLWQTMPDDALFAAAETGALSTPEGVRTEVARMMLEPQFESTLRSFHEQWLHLNKVAEAQKVREITPAWTPALQNAMLQEADLFIKSVFDEQAGLADLLTGTYSFLSPELAQLYGVTHPTGSGFARVDNIPHRHGVLTLPAILAGNAHPDQTAPVRRGELIRKQLLCTDPPPPPNDLVIVLPAVDPNLSTRERFAQHTEEAGCATCHILMDPLGLTLENYDEFGLWRDTDGNQPVNAQGELTAIASVASNADPSAAVINGPAELGQKLATLPEVQKCVVLNWFRYASGHTEEAADTCTINSLLARFGTSEQNLADLVVAIAESDGFRYRVHAAGSAP